MCKQGDIILINGYRDHGTPISKHSFIVISDDGGQVRGVPYDFIALVMSSFKNEEQKARKLRYPGNMPISSCDKDMEDWANNKDGYIKAEQFYYFNKDKICFSVIGSINDDFFNLLMDFIESLASRNVQIDQIIDNL